VLASKARGLAGAAARGSYAAKVTREASMEPDLTIELINATVQIEQALPDGRRRVGTGFLIDAPTPDGRPRTVLVTAGHVFETMPADSVRIGWRLQNEDRSWRYVPQPVTIRLDGQALYTRHPSFDIAVMKVEAPPEFARSAIPLSWLADERSFEEWGVGPGDEMMTVGYPVGYSANEAGFPILRTGRVASYPMSPISEFPTFLVDLSVLGGNSGGPVFMAGYSRRRPGTEHAPESFLAGVVIKQLCFEIAVVVHAAYVRETIRFLDDPGLMRPSTRPAAAAPTVPAVC
jgi:S1-C subfamily serine protease